MGQSGGITAAEASRAITQATLEYLTLSAAVDAGKVPAGAVTLPDAPAHWEIYWQIRRTNKLWWDGGLSDQPFWLMLEIDAIGTGVDRFEENSRKQATAAAALQAQMQQVK